jgi:hypothetical protein
VCSAGFDRHGGWSLGIRSRRELRDALAVPS